eukprot:2153790-Rhodomonas_salina.1
MTTALAAPGTTEPRAVQRQYRADGDEKSEKGGDEGDGARERGGQGGVGGEGSVEEDGEEAETSA